MKNIEIELEVVSTDIIIDNTSMSISSLKKCKFNQQAIIKNGYPIGLLRNIYVNDNKLMINGILHEETNYKRVHPEIIINKYRYVKDLNLNIIDDFTLVAVCLTE